MQLEPSRALPAGLSERELEVLLALAHGGSNREIAEDLGISAKTVGHHVQRVYAKTGVHSRAAATSWAYENHLGRLALGDLVGGIDPRGTTRARVTVSAGSLVPRR